MNDSKWFYSPPDFIMDTEHYYPFYVIGQSK